ncbi:hypothetical protein F53441_5586 [Fusarium austroafricanum]|uniref:Uncharacterized protein n=1 Tax=Fusarium austroafricanum TaxID=2364996 RepID=A0A8H4KKJ5_9HYPO|nr:hypothetical protein F53441_5586 [Fusarium austroafricanum]
MTSIHPSQCFMTTPILSGNDSAWDNTEPIFKCTTTQSFTFLQDDLHDVQFGSSFPSVWAEESRAGLGQVARWSPSDGGQSLLPSNQADSESCRDGRSYDMEAGQQERAEIDSDIDSVNLGSADEDISRGKQARDGVREDSSKDVPGQGLENLTPPLEIGYEFETLPNLLHDPSAYYEHSSIVVPAHTDSHNASLIRRSADCSGSEKDIDDIQVETTSQTAPQPILFIDLTSSDVDDIRSGGGRSTKRRKNHVPHSKTRPGKRRKERSEHVNLRVEAITWTPRDEGHDKELTYGSRSGHWVTDTDYPDIAEVSGEFLLSHGREVKIKVRPNLEYLPIDITWRGTDTFNGFAAVDGRRLEVDYNSVLDMVLDGQRGEGVLYGDS